MSEESSPEPAGLGVGSSVAVYRLDELIGRGGMAVVYRAFDRRLRRRVALKILTPELARDREFRLRFIRESRAAAAVDHPNIIPIFEAGEASGVLFIAMRFVGGPDVRTLIDTHGPLPAARAAAIVSQVASALDVAHAYGLVHRDVKPANMLRDAVPYADQPDHIYLSDFGLSKRSLASSGLTSQGHFLGTLNYVAPEQIEGRPVEGNADQYALACSAFEMLSGEPPFRRDDNMAIMWAQVHAAPPPLTHRRRELPTAVDDVMARALAKVASDRYGTCLEFADALRKACGLSRSPAGPRLPGASRPLTREMSTAGLAGGPAQAGEAAGGVAAGTPLVPTAPAVTGLAPRVPAPSGPAVGAPAVSAPAVGGPAVGGPAATSLAPGDTVPPGTIPTGTTPPGTTVPAPRQAPRQAPRRPAHNLAPPPGPRRRRLRRSSIIIAAACVAVLGTAGGYLLAAGGHPRPQPAPAGTHSSAGYLTTVVAPPGCTETGTAGRILTNLPPSHFVKIGGLPFDVVTTGHGLGFATNGSTVTVLNTAHGVPTLRQTIPLPGAQGEALTRDQRYLLVAAGSGLSVFKVGALKHGSHAALGTLTSPGARDAKEIALSADGRFAFLTLMGSNKVAVFNLQHALASGFRPSADVGTIPIRRDPVGLAMSPDGRYLYVASGLARPAAKSGPGTLTVIDAVKAETSPGSAVMRQINAGCGPDRVLASPDGRYVWVTSGGGNALLGYSAARLVSDPRHALLASVALGQLPLGLVLVHHGSLLVVADSNRDKLGGATSGLAVVGVRKALARNPGAVLGLINTGLTPRQFALEPGGTILLVTDTESGQVQAINVAHLP